MTSLRIKGARFGLALLGMGMILAGGSAAAQVASSPPYGAAGEESAADALSRNVRSLAADPRSLPALMGAGRAALEMGDAQAALTFFARGEEIAPRDGRIKMWIGSALVQLEQPRPALKFFDDAIALGVAEADIARDRGLAYDIMGDPRRAQRDYELALRHGRDPETTRRLALSLGISGERERALQLLEEQLLVRDPAAERTRALVLALTGDTAGASRAAQAAMPGPQSGAMAPFLARLPSLSQSERALAVHFGHFPGTGQTMPAPIFDGGSYASRDAARDPVTSAGAPDSGQAAFRARVAPPPEPVSIAPRRRPGAEDAPAAPAVRMAQARPRPAPPTVRHEPPQTGPDDAAALGGPEPAKTSPPPAPVRAAAGRLAGVAATIADLSDTPERAAAPARTNAARPPAATAGRPPSRIAAAASSRRDKPKAAPPPPREPSRAWVQLASGAIKAALPRNYAGIKAKAPKLLGSRTAWTVANNATNRLLVGPFAGSREAQAFVNELAKAHVPAFAWTSEAGQKIERLPAR